VRNSRARFWPSTYPNVCNSSQKASKKGVERGGREGVGQQADPHNVLRPLCSDGERYTEKSQSEGDDESNHAALHRLSL
jgi:hypothetical protein